MRYSEYLNIHPLERAAMAEFAVALEADRREFQADLVEALAKSLPG